MMKTFTLLCTIFLLYVSTAFAAVAPTLGSAGNFAVLAGAAVTCTHSTVVGDIGVYPGTAVTRTNCTITGTVHAGDTVAAQAQSDFNLAYVRLDTPCGTGDRILTGTLAGITLTPGTYCFVAAAALTGTLTLDAQGDPNAVWIFKVGTDGTGALTGTNFTVLLINGAEPCNVYWWVRQAVTLTDSTFQGTVLAGAAITVTRGAFNGDAFAKAAVTLTNAVVSPCGLAIRPGRTGCNQGVGNGPEGCDPGNSNQDNPNRSNDELGGTPGNPGRKNGNK